jgi:O-acetyl-ADP-ribose deacetylase (regulator of RNase III)
MIKYVKGDLFESGLRGLAHGCNVQGVMNAGIAKTFRAKYPAMYAGYRAHCKNGDYRLGDSMWWREEKTGLIIFNLATQNLSESANPDAIDLAVGIMLRQAILFNIKEIGMPWIGCGIGGLKFGELQEILTDYHASPVDIIVYEYNA